MYDTLARFGAIASNVKFEFASFCVFLRTCIPSGIRSGLLFSAESRSLLISLISLKARSHMSLSIFSFFFPSARHPLSIAVYDKMAWPIRKAYFPEMHSGIDFVFDWKMVIKTRIIIIYIFTNFKCEFCLFIYINFFSKHVANFQQGCMF